MAPVVRVLTGYTLVIDQAGIDILRFGAPLVGRSAGTPRTPVSRTPSGGSCPEESAQEGKGLARTGRCGFLFCPKTLAVSRTPRKSSSCIVVETTAFTKSEDACPTIANPKMILTTSPEPAEGHLSIHAVDTFNKQASSLSL